MPERMVATDLDQTLLFSPAAAARLGGVLPAAAVEVLDGVVISELADVVRAGLRSMTIPVVPTTTRTPAQLLRIDWPVPMPWAVAASGAVILRDGAADPDWAAEMAPFTADEPAARALLERVVGSFSRVRSAKDFAYAVGDPSRLAERVGELVGSAAEMGWRVEHQERKLYLLPAAVDKAHAVRRVAGLLGASTVWAAGDSLLDAGLVAAADRAWVPARSPLAATALGAHVTVTPSPGHAAAAEIVAAWQD